MILPVIAKIEKPQAIENLDEVIAAFDGFMVARGDLGVECPAEEVPFLQKKIIDKARLNAKPVIVATQMLESMISSPSPTRAEVSDVANAILDGADAVMLSGETGVGEYPVHTVETMARIIQATEAHAMEQHEVGTLRALPWDPHTKSGVIAKAAGEVAERIDAKYVVAFTQSGDSARRMSRLRGPVPVLAFTPEAQTRSQLSLSLGRRDVQDRRGRAHRRDGRPGRRAAAQHRPGREGRPRRHHRRLAPGHPGLHQRAARAPDGRRGRRRRAGVPAAAPA